MKEGQGSPLKIINIRRMNVVMKVTMIMAMTADGMIARDRSHFPDWTCRSDKRMFKKMTQTAGVVIFGSKTYDTIGKALPGRMNVVITRHPERYQPAENLIFTDNTPDQLLSHLSSKGFENAILAGGSVINSLFLKSGCIDEMLITIAPKLFGQGLPIFSESCDLDLELLSAETLDVHSLVLRYRVLYP